MKKYNIGFIVGVVVSTTTQNISDGWKKILIGVAICLVGHYLCDLIGKEGD